VQITDEPTVPPTDILIGKLTDEVLTDGLLDDEVTVETSFPFNTWVRQTDGMVMVHVPKGEFEMGSDVGEADERPVHKVGLDEFWFDQTAVTNSQYALCVKARECGVSGYVDDVDFGGGDYPVVGVSWYDAANYCEWVGARLPTEAEWEYAARGPENLVYPWGNSFDCLRGNFDDETSLDIISFGCDGYLKTSPVGSFPEGASWCGVLDLSGNVWDWVEDWYAEYPSENQENPTGSITGEYKVIRGGSWGSDNNLLLRGASRNSRDPNGSNNIVIGFRCAMSEIEN
jgi:formylglycine-generating enzyme required for sulfatase activity